MIITSGRRERVSTLLVLFKLVIYCFLNLMKTTSGELTFGRSEMLTTLRWGETTVIPFHTGTLALKMIDGHWWWLMVVVDEMNHEHWRTEISHAWSQIYPLSNLLFLCQNPCQKGSVSPSPSKSKGQSAKSLAQQICLKTESSSSNYLPVGGCWIYWPTKSTK